jgi:hypothetical protein
MRFALAAPAPLIVGASWTPLTSCEPGALMYEWSVSDDESATTERFLATVSPTRVVVYGSPTDRAREALDGYESKRA